MSETPTEYLDSISVKCPGCGARIGKYYPMPHNETWIKVGDLILSELHGFHQCRPGHLEEFHFCYTSKTLEDLIGRCNK